MNVGYMESLDYVTLVLFFLVTIDIGIWSKRSIKGSEDFYVGDEKIPRWLSGVSHYVSGYSGVVFVGYAGIVYAHGTLIYFWWAVNIALATALGVVTLTPRWPRLCRALGIQSPTEYLKMRYNTAAQPIVVTSGVIAKLLDVGAKWTSLGILLHGFTGLPIWMGIITSSLASMIYISIGDLIADLLTDFVQFGVNLLAGLLLFFAVLNHLGEHGLTLTTMFSALPASSVTVFNKGRGWGSLSWTLLYLFIVYFSYNGDTWNLAARLISAEDDHQAKKTAFLPSALYLIWPLILFSPMWCGPILFPGWTQAEAEASLYASLAGRFLPVGLAGLMLAAMFVQTMSMCNSDMNTISTVITRDILTKIKPSLSKLGDNESLKLARATTIAFAAGAVVIGLLRDQLDGVTGIIFTWLAALLGPTAIPLLFSPLPQFKYYDSKAATASMIGGLGVFVVTEMGVQLSTDMALIAPLLTSFVIFLGVGLYNQYVKKIEIDPQIEDLMAKLESVK